MCRRVGVAQANGYVLGALGYAARLTGDRAAATAAVGQAVESSPSWATTWPGRRRCISGAACTATAVTIAAAEAAFRQAGELRMAWATGAASCSPRSTWRCCGPSGATSRPV